MSSKSYESETYGDGSLVLRRVRSETTGVSFSADLYLQDAPGETIVEEWDGGMLTHSPTVRVQSVSTLSRAAVVLACKNAALAAAGKRVGKPAHLRTLKEVLGPEYAAAGIAAKVDHALAIAARSGRFRDLLVA